MSNLLLHICCGVCALGIVKKLKEERHQITGYFYNPNIHPFMEFRKRLRAVEVMAEQEKIPVLYETDYGLESFLAAVAPYAKSYETQRCEKCYEMRLRQTARKAKELGLDGFTSTLIISPQQNQPVIRNLGEKFARDNGLIFKYDAITELYPECKEMAKKRMLYRQQYCGCIFSEYERYHHKDE
jgi:epoxyqueuosine reductase